MPEVLVQGDRIHYLEGGKFHKSHPTLLFIHGAGQSTTTWRLQQEIFADHEEFNFIALDLPGHGCSKGNAFSTVEEYKEFVLEFIQTLELGEVILIGHSMGGGIGMLMAIENPEYMKACVLVATGAKLSVAKQTLELVKDNFASFCEISPQRMFAEDSPKELKQEFRNGLLDTGQQVCYQDLIACNEFNITNDVYKINVPTLIISADKDILTPLKYGDYLHQKIYASQFSQIKDSGHFIMQERVQEFNRVLMDFLNDLSSDTN